MHRLTVFAGYVTDNIETIIKTYVNCWNEWKFRQRSNAEFHEQFFQISQSQTKNQINMVFTILFIKIAAMEKYKKTATGVITVYKKF